MVCVYNTTRQPQKTTLTIDSERLKSEVVLDAYTREMIELSGKSLTVEVPALNYRLLWIK